MSGCHGILVRIVVGNAVRVAGHESIGGLCLSNTLQLTNNHDTQGMVPYIPNSTII